MIESVTPTEPPPLAPATDAAAPRVDPGAAWAGPHEFPTSAADGHALTMLSSAADGPACADGSCALPTPDGPC
jgi:hypothetical protein